MPNERPTMTHPTSMLLLAAGLAITSLPAAAQTAPTPHHVRKAKAAKVAAPQPAWSNGINRPSADFSTVEPPRGDDADDRQPGSNVRPMMGESGNIGFGTGF